MCRRNIPPRPNLTTPFTHITIPQSDTHVSGPIPREIRHLVNLERLGLSASEHNMQGRMGISGSIPPEIGELRSLKKLWLQRTRISGSIPPEIAKLQNLTHLYLFATDISGSIPKEVKLLVVCLYLYSWFRICSPTRSN